MGRNNGLSDRQSHARAANLITLIAATIELIKNEPCFEGVNARTMISNAENNRVAGSSAEIVMGFSFRRIKMSIVDKLDQNVLGAIEIGEDRRQVLAYVLPAPDGRPRDFFKC